MSRIRKEITGAALAGLVAGGAIGYLLAGTGRQHPVMPPAPQHIANQSSSSRKIPTGLKQKEQHRSPQTFDLSSTEINLVEKLPANTESTLVRELAEQHPALADELFAEAEKRLAEQMFYGLFPNMASNQPARAAQLALATENPHLRSFALLKVAELWPKQDVDAAFAWFRGLSGQDRETAFPMIFEAYAAEYPQAAAQFAQSTEAGSLRGEALYNVAAQWSESDAAGAFNWIRDMPQEELGQLYPVVMNRYIEQDPQAASALVYTLPSGDQQLQFIEKLGRHLAELDLQYAFDWANVLSDEKARSTALNSAIAVWAVKEPQQALQYSVEHLSGSRQEEVISAALREISRQSPEEAAATVANLPNAMAEKHTQRIVDEWYRKGDSERVEAWITGLSNGVVLDQASLVAFQKNLSRDPKSALKWVDYISRPEVQEKAARNLIQALYGDYRKASQLVQETITDPEKKAVILERIKALSESSQIFVMPRYEP